MERKGQVVEGYRFGTEADKAEALLEIEKATYFEQRLSGRTAENILAVYDKMLDEKTFVTPVGWEYLKYLQERLEDEGVTKDRIRPIPMYQTFYHTDIDKKPNKGIAKERIQPSSKKKWTADEKFKLSMLANVFLCILVLALFVITLKGENANALNYRQAIINEYASWEQELSEREQALKEYRQEMEDE